jgi:hypothetical protein
LIESLSAFFVPSNFIHLVWNHPLQPWVGVEHARLLQRLGRPAEALGQVDTILTDQPNHREGKRPRDALERDRAEKK